MLLTAAVGTVTAAATTSSTAAPAPAPNACTLVTGPELASMLGGTVSDGSLTTAPDGTESVCGWVVTVRASRGYGAQLAVYGRRSAADFSLERRIAPGRTRTVRHLGDSAFSERAVGGGEVYDDLWVRRGAVQFRVEVLRDLGSKRLESVARLVLTRL